MKQILVLGAGLVAKPLVDYLLEKENIKIKVADCILSKAEKLVGSHPRGKAQLLDVNNDEALRKIIKEADLVVSLLPWIYHIKIAKLCLEYKKHLVTASYVRDEMKALDEEVKKADLLFLNEIGLDPGIDHMSAMKIIDNVKEKGGDIISFHSYCGGFPAMKDNTNPWGYKFSWSPRGVLLAAKNDGKYLKNGEIIDIPNKKLFEHYWLQEIPDAGIFEAYVNRNALPYIDIYDIKNTKSMYRGTLRNISHCETWEELKKLGMFDDEKIYNFKEYTPYKLIAEFIGLKEKESLWTGLKRFLNLPEHSIVLRKFEWLGMFEDKPIELENGTALNMLDYLMDKKLQYNEGEVDLILLHHEFIAEYKDYKELITSTLITTGTPNGDSAMSKTVALPVAIAVDLIINNKIDLRGVWIPIHPKIYEPVLEELANLGITMIDRVKIVNS